ncbi:MAG: DUF4928 family protein [Pirellulales bacterium]|nr:DUF4928 family protein [Pirellulales bacterium]
MHALPKINPLIEAIQKSFVVKRRKKDDTIPRSWLLVVLCLLDMIGDSDHVLSEDEVYTYDYTLKRSRAAAIPKLLEKHSFPLKLGMGAEGITTRGAPGLRLFREIEGGGVIAGHAKDERLSLVSQAIGFVRDEMLKTVGQGPVQIPSHCFDRPRSFVESLLEAVANRSNGRVEQALVGAKLALRFPKATVPHNPGFAGDRQTGRDCDFEVDDLRVIVSVSPKKQHYESAAILADQGRTVHLVVAKKSLDAASRKLGRARHKGDIIVHEVEHYVTSNMSEIATDRKITSREMCLILATEYNQRIRADNDESLQVTMPD